MSRNYDNWDRLVAAVVKREQYWQLAHQDSISTIFSDSDSSSTISPAPVSLGSFCITDTFETLQQLGEGELGTTILAQLLQDVRVSDQQYLEVGAKAVTKLLETVCVREDEFEQQMIVLGNCRHENVGAPWAYYFSETTKLMVYDYYSQGSVFDMLHGNGSTRPNWESRVRIAIGAARGIAHIHAQCGGKLTHGNIKSSNIFVNRQGYGCVSDFGLAAGILEWSEKWRANDSQLVLNQPSQKSDVFSFGQLLLELVTRKSPMEASWSSTADRLRSLPSRQWHLRGNDHEMCWKDPLYAIHPSIVDDLALSVEGSIVWVDSELIDSVAHELLHKTLEVAEMCLALLPDDRPTMPQVLLMLHDVPDYRRRCVDNKPFWHRLLPFGR